MTEEEFKKAMNKLVIFIFGVIIIFGVIAVLVFKTSNKEMSIFGSESEKNSYKDTVNEINNDKISEEQASKIDGENNLEPENVEEQNTNQENISEELSMEENNKTENSEMENSQ